MKKFLLFLLVVLSSPSFAGALTLQETVDLALSQNPQVTAAQEKVKAAAARRGQAVAAMLPSLTLSGAYGRYYSQPYFYLLPDETATIVSYSLQLNQPLFVSALFPGYSIANAGYQAANEEYRRARNETAVSAIIIYYSVLKAQKALEIASASFKNMERYARQVEAFVQSGLATQSDLMLAETQVANLKVAIVSLQSAVQLARASFNSILSRDLETSFELKETAKVPLLYKPAPLAELLKEAEVKRPEIRALALARQISSDSVGLAKSGYLPSFYLTGSAGRQGSKYHTTTYDLDLGNWQMTFSGSWALFNGFGTQAKVAEAQANLNAFAAEEKSARDAIALEIKAAYLNWQSAEEKLAAAAEAEELAQKSLKLAEASYASQIGTNLAVLNSQTAYDQAATNLSNARYDLEIAKANLDKAVGIDL